MNHKKLDEGGEKIWYDGLEEIVHDDLRFKAKLNIGEDALASNRFTKSIRETWGAAGMAGTTVVIATSGPVASTFFAPSGVLAFFGLSTAVTPVGWVIASSVLASVGYIGITRCLRDRVGNGTIAIPQFINTPIDLLAVALFDLMAPIALKLAAADGKIDHSERDVIDRYFINDWGLNEQFVRQGLDFVEKDIEPVSLEDITIALASYKKNNKDCNYREMSREFIQFLNEIVAADGKVDTHEQEAIRKVKLIFKGSENEYRKGFRGLQKRLSESTKKKIAYVSQKFGRS